MGTENLTTGERIAYFADICYGLNRNLADSLGISPQNLNQHINNKRSPSLDVLKNYWRVGLNIEWLLTGEGSFFSNSETGIKLRYEIRTKTLFQIVYAYLSNKKNPEKNEFLNLIFNFSFLLNKDYLSFAYLIKKIKDLDFNNLNFINSEFFLCHMIEEKEFRTIFDDLIIDANYDIIEKITIPWPIKNTFVPKYITVRKFIFRYDYHINQDLILNILYEATNRIKLEKVIPKELLLDLNINNIELKDFISGAIEYENALEFLENYKKMLANNTDSKSIKEYKTNWAIHVKGSKYFTDKHVWEIAFPEHKDIDLETSANAVWAKEGKKRKGYYFTKPKFDDF